MGISRIVIIREGDSVRLPNWTNAVVEIKDIGKHSFWGILIDIKTNHIIAPTFVAPIEGEWLKVLSIEDVI